MTLDDIQAEYDFSEVHSTQVKAGASEVFDCIKEITPSEIAGVMRFLIWLRTLPEKMAGRRQEWMNREAPLLAQMIGGHFTLLAENPPHEIVLGLLIPGKTGRVWQKSSMLDTRSADLRDFLAFDQPEYIRVVVNLLVESTGNPEVVTIRTETRCRALSPRARRDFAPYWRLIRPFSGLIRIVWLRGIKRKAERSMSGHARREVSA